MEKKKVFVGLSGGVDSSVSAYLLKEVGYDVTGVFIKVWQPDFVPCTWKEDRLDAMRVAAMLDIPFKTLDLEEIYKKEVVDYLIDEYKKGRTPNPDVFCNKEVKFGAFLDWALKEGADFVATGHYAQNIDGKLVQSVDEEKEQSYFLWTLTNEQLKHILFPVGAMKKEGVRKIAGKAKLPTATKKDSQGLCFISNVNMKDFLKHFIESKKGEVLNEVGEVIGEHDGAFLFTPGERHGFSVFNKTPDDTPQYVVSKDISKNTIIVSMKKPEESGKKIFILEQLNLNAEIPEGKIIAQVRYHGEMYPCTLNNNEVTFDQNILVSPGQSVVFYKNKICLGGGIIHC